MLSKFKLLTKFKKDSSKQFDLSYIKKQLNDGLFNVMLESFDQKQADTTNSKFTEKDINKIIESYARKNMMLAAAASIIPGPFGVSFSSLPQTKLNTFNSIWIVFHQRPIVRGPSRLQTFTNETIRIINGYDLYAPLPLHCHLIKRHSGSIS